MYDLPGGGIEKGETHSETLLREFIEEVGCEVQTYNFLHQDHYECPYVGSTGIERDFKHTGFYFSVSLTVRAEIKSEPDGQDSLGAEYIELKNIVSDNVVVAPMARKAILFLANQKNLV
jgi:8-oxo-dGTP pyrophosphatase MutT (NUDIX family)